MMTFLNVFRSVGGKLEIEDGPTGGIRFWHPGDELTAVALETDVHPGFMTDWQQPMVVALTQARGLSIVHETVYERRLGYTAARWVPPSRPPRLPGRHPCSSASAASPTPR
jgi:UDP-N-acetylglucosamine 1-carboxyvinyltransferase